LLIKSEHQKRLEIKIYLEIFEVANELFCQHINSGGKAILADNPSKLGLEKGKQYRLEIQDEINKLYDEILTKLAGKILFLTA
jgi:hypothetical protein